MEALMRVLQQHPAFGAIKVEYETVRVFLNQPLEAAEVNLLMHSHQIVLSHLVKRKESLEEQFLSLTQNLPN